MIVDASRLWSKIPSARLRGFCLAREKGWLLAWDRDQALSLLDPAGEVQARVRCEEPLVGEAVSDDGSTLVAVGQNGVVRGLNPDLTPRWNRTLNVTPLALALDAFGKFLALADSRGGVHFLDGEGQLAGRFQSPRPLHHLAFIPAARQVVACADYGLVGAVDPDGAWLWRDAPVMHAGSLSVNGDGTRLVLACFSEGLQFYGAKGKKLGQVPLPEACPVAAMSYTGDLIVAAGMSSTLYFLDGAGKLASQFAADRPAQAIAMGALGRTAYVLSKEGDLSCWKITTTQRAG